MKPARAHPFSAKNKSTRASLLLHLDNDETAESRTSYAGFPPFGRIPRSSHRRPRLGGATPADRINEPRRFNYRARLISVRMRGACDFRGRRPARALYWVGGPRYISPLGRRPPPTGESRPTCASGKNRRRLGRRALCCPCTDRG